MSFRRRSTAPYTLCSSRPLFIECCVQFCFQFKARANRSRTTFRRVCKIATISLATSVRLSVRPQGTTWLPMDGLHLFSENLSRKFKFHWNATKITGNLHECQFDHISLSSSSNEKCFRCKENQSAHFIFLRKSCRLWENVEKYCWAGQVTDDNMVHAHCTVDTSGYIHTLRTCNNYCFSTATMVARTGLNVTVYDHWVSCYKTSSLPVATYTFSIWTVVGINPKPIQYTICSLTGIVW